MADDVTLRIGGIVDGAVRALKQVQAEIQKTTTTAKDGGDRASDALGKTAGGAEQAGASTVKALDAIGRRYTALGQSVSGVGTRMTVAFTAPIALIAGAGVQSAMRFESAFANVRKTVDATNPQLDALALSFREMAKEIPATTEELSEIAALGGQMGVPIEQLESFTRNVAALGVAVDGISTEAATSGLAAIGNVAHGNVDKIANMASALVNLGNNSNATEGDILEFTKRLIGAGTTIGLTVPEVMAIGTAMANLGINAEAGGTAFSTVMSKMAEAVANGGDDLEAFARVAGMTAEQFADTFRRKPIEAIDAFVRGLGRSKDAGENLYKALGDVGAEGVRMRDVLLRMANANDQVSRSLVFANDGYETANKHLSEAEKKYATTQNQIKLFWNRLNDVGIELGSVFLPVINRVLQGLVPFVDMLGGVVRAFQSLPTPVQTGIVAFLGLVALAGPLVYFTGQVIQSAGAIMTLSSRLPSLVASVNAARAGFSLSSVAVAGFTAALAGIVVPFALIKVTEFVQQLLGYLNDVEQWRRDDANEATVHARVVAEATRLMGREVKNAAEANRLLFAYAAGMRGEAIKGKDVTLEMAEAWNKGAAAAGKAGAAFDTTGLTITRLVPTQGAAKASTDALSDGMRAAAERAAKYDADLKKVGAEGLRIIRQEHERGIGLDKLATEWKVSQESLERYINSTKSATKAFEQTPIEQFRERLSKLADILTEAEKNQASVAVVTNQYGKQIADVVQEASVYGVEVPAVIKRAYDAAKQYNLGVALAEAMPVIADQWQKLQAFFAAKGREQFDADLAAWLKQGDSILDIKRRTEELIVRTQGESLERQLEAIARRANQERALTDFTKSNWIEKIQAVNAWEEAAAENATRVWQEHVREASREALTFENIFRNAIQSVPRLLQDALTGGGGLGGGLKAILSKVGGDIGGRLFGDLAAKLSAPLFSAFGGTVTSAMGVLIPGLGQAIGSLIGPLVGKLASMFTKSDAEKAMEDVGRRYGTKISEGLAKQIAEDAKKKYGGSQQLAEMFNLDKIIKEAGGLNSRNFQQFVRQIRDVFSFVERGQVSTIEAGRILDESFGTFAKYITDSGQVASRQFVELIELNARFGTNSKQIADFVQQQTARIGTALAGVVKPLATEYQGLAQRIADAREELAKTDDVEQRAAAELKLKELMRQQAEGVDKYGASLERMGRLALAAFNSAIAGGADMLDAVDALGPGLDTIIQAMKDLGLEVEGSTVAWLIAFRDRVNANRELVESAGALNQLMLAMSNIGALNVDTLKDLEAQGLQTYENLIAKGFTQNEALTMMKGFLENVIQAHRDLGIPIDEATQKLIDQARAQGILKDEAVSTNDILLEGFAALIEAVGGKLPDAFRKMRDAARERFLEVQEDAADTADSIEDELKRVRVPTYDIKYRVSSDGGGDDDGGGEVESSYSSTSTSTSTVSDAVSAALAALKPTALLDLVQGAAAAAAALGLVASSSVVSSMAATEGSTAQTVAATSQANTGGDVFHIEIPIYEEGRERERHRVVVTREELVNGYHPVPSRAVRSEVTYG